MSIKIVGRQGVFGSRPTIEITSLDGEYSSLAAELVREFVSRELGVAPAMSGSAER